MSYSVAIHWLFIVRASDNTQLHKKTNQGRGQQKERGGKKEKHEEGRKTKTNATSSESSCTCRRSARNPNWDK